MTVRPEPGPWAASLILCLLLVAVPLPSRADVQTADPMIQEFVVPDGISSPHSVAVSPSGNVWFAEKVGKNLVMFDPVRKTFEVHALPSDWGNVGPSRIALAPGGSVWFSVRRWANSDDDTWFLGRFDPTVGLFRRYLLADPDAVQELGTDQGNVSPDDLLIDRNGLVWFLSPEENKVYSFEPDGAGLRGYPIPTPHCYPKGIAIDGGDTIWFAEANANKIGKFVPASATFNEYEIPTPFANPETLTVDGAGRVWFVELRTNRLSVFYPEGERFYEALIPTAGGLPNAIAAGGSGEIWFLEYMGNKIGVFDPVQAQFKEFDIPTYASLPGDIAIDLARDRVWFSESGTEARRLAMLSMSKARSTVAATAAVTETSDAWKALPEEHSGPLIVVTVAVAALLVAFGALFAWFVFWRQRTA
ncbi:MAG: hypothetical protein GY791_00625 [Alphaproteobacteria bacterium]|nr:hypothetical protein [Alphaproteobacteria bacterium]